VPVQRPRAPAKAAVAPRGRDTAREETELVAAARNALAEQDWARALATLDEHARRFADGVLAEERSALRAIALCRSGAEPARAAVLDFDSRYPGSHHHRSIELACDERSEIAPP
ncbi:MAG TPA: hypothetical protein VFG69_16710, partial [Nannocystaceae bacterium]|nr:hypothetical protein [Nannocystaceae bacterium]